MGAGVGPGVGIGVGAGAGLGVGADTGLGAGADAGLAVVIGCAIFVVGAVIAVVGGRDVAVAVELMLEPFARLPFEALNELGEGVRPICSGLTEEAPSTVPCGLTTGLKPFAVVCTC